MRRPRRPRSPRAPHTPQDASLRERYHYTDAGAFLAALETSPATPGIGTDGMERMERRFRDESHYGREWQGGFSSYTDARTAAETGVSKTVRAVAAPACAATLAPGIAARTVHAIAGGSVCVPRVLEGRPDPMRRIIRAPRPQRVARVRVNFGANCHVSAEALEARGLEVLAAVAAVERQGVMAEIIVGCRLDSWSGPTAAFTITLKRPGQPLDWQKAAFWLSAPAALRVFAFQWAWKCVSPAMLEALGQSLGHAVALDPDPACALDIGTPASDFECRQAKAEKFVETMLTAVRK